MRNLNRIGPGIVLVAGVLVLAYITVKASVSSFTHDESYTYLHYISGSFLDIISNQGAYSNNHVLNTLFMKYSEQLFGCSERALRLPNLLMLIVFFIYTYLLLKKAGPVICVAVFILTATNSALVDFFGLARGYGLSMGFMMMGLFHLVRAFDGRRNIHLLFFNLASLLAVLSNFTMLGFYLSGLAVFNLVHLLEARVNSRDKFAFFQLNKVNLISFVVLFTVLYEPVRKALKFNSFDFGGKQGFIHDTVTSLILHLFTGVQFSPAAIFIMQAFLVAISLVPLVILAVQTVRNDPEFLMRNRAMIVVNLVLLSISAGTILQHWILKTDFPVGRFSLFLVPLFLLNAGFLLQYLLAGNARFLIYGVAVVLAVLSVSNFYRNSNLHVCAEWAYDSGTKDAVMALEADQKRTVLLHDRQVRIGINWLFEPTINFYRQTRNLKWLMPADRSGLSETDDYVYLFKADTSGMPRNMKILLYSSEQANTVLLKPL